MTVTENVMTVITNDVTVIEKAITVIANVMTVTANGSDSHRISGENTGRPTILTVNGSNSNYSCNYRKCNYFFFFFFLITEII